jgi:segment polarity protein dishevelled
LRIDYLVDEFFCFILCSRVSVETVSTITSLQQQQQQQARRKVYTKKRVPRSTSMSTMTTSTMSDASMDILTVTLNMDAYNFLGISIVGHANDDGVGGIYVGTVMKGGAVAADGRIETGDMLLQVNDINFENMSNDDAVRTLRELVQQPGPITLTVAKCLEPEAYAPMFEPRLEPIRPLDPTAWVMQTNAQRVEYSRPFTGSPTLSTMTSNSSPSLASSIPESERDLVKLTLSSPLYRVAKAMAQSDSGLEVKDRMWLKMTIPKSFIGSDVVDWLYNNVDGFIDRRHSRKYAAILLKQGFIRHTVNKITFSEQCYYVFGDFKRAINILPNGITDMHLSDNSGGETDTLGPLPGDMGQAWSSSEDQLTLPPYESNYYSHSHSHSRSPENRHTGSSGSSSSAANDNGNNYHHPPSHPPPPPHPQMVPPQPPRMGRMKHSSSLSSASEFTSVSQQHVPNDRLSLRSFHVGQQQMGGPNNASGSRASFQQAIDNPCEYFIDVM